jgi:hypothetical protein
MHHQAQLENILIFVLPLDREGRRAFAEAKRSI